MNRRDAIRNLSLLGVGLILPIGKLIPAPSKKPLHFIGLGGAGSVLAEHFFKMGLPGMYTCIDGNRKPELPSEFGYVRFHAPAPAKELFGHRFYEVSDLHEYQGFLLEIKALVEGDVSYVVLAGLGGFTGSYLSMHLSDLLHHYNKDYIMLGTFPFSFEGKQTHDIANSATNRMSQHSKVMTYYLDGISSEFRSIGLQEAFRIADKKIYSMFTG